MHLVKLTTTTDDVHIFATRHYNFMAESRVRRQQCHDILLRTGNWTLLSAIHAVNVTEGNARIWCLANTFCTGYKVENNRVWYSNSYAASSKTGRRYKEGATAYILHVRCPIHQQRCNDMSCKNGGTCINIDPNANGVRCVCGANWTDWYCQRRKSCPDEPCVAGALCHNSSIVGFTCTCPPFTTGMMCDVHITTPTTSTTTANNTTVGGGLSTHKKVAIAAAAAGGVILTGVAATAVISATSSAAGATGASAAVGGGGQ